ncbi:substrate-binding domain-containing protein [Chryseolinea sp. H1M3-3]|uniref:LacI family DNA-binding transcriptional regulator n=1 Tax=Chryseolinea sp. H1M3-3 TaxID=3034144 RepID=UPI0023EB3678|nr:substrate-binding domain-containing protein [Chryseolinea sp. H1M3-3]
MDLGKNIRIKDIAKLAGVSVGTVDRVIHNRGRVSQEALKKVTSVMEQIDYKPNLIARTLGSNKNYRIAAIIPNPEQDPYWSQSNKGILQAQAEWTQYGINIDLHVFDLFNKESFITTVQEAIATKPDGIVVAPIFYHEALPVFDLLKTEQIPYVLFNTNIPEATPLSFIGQNLYQSGKVAAQLLHFGQENPGTFAVLHMDEDIQDSLHLVEKEKGFREYFSSNGKAKFEIMALNLNPSDSAFETQLNELVNNPNLKGIFVTTSKGSAVAASFLEKHSKKHIRLIGYDLLDENLKYLKTGTIDFLIHQNPKRQAFLGISHLVNHLMFKKSMPQQELFPLEVITEENLGSYLNSGLH